MFEKLRIIFSIPELRKKVLLTIGLLAVYRIGFHIPLPMIATNLADTGGTASEFFEKITVFAASDLRQATIFGLGIMPYISASIIFQLLGSVYKPLEELKKEGEAGRKKLNEYTRYLTVAICRAKLHVPEVHADVGRAGWVRQYQPELPECGCHRSVLWMADHRGARDDLWNRVPDVAGRADR